jgi:hypothetical protein
MPSRITCFNGEAIKLMYKEWVRDGKVVIPEIAEEGDGPLKLISITEKEFLERLDLLGRSTTLATDYKEKVEWLISNHMSHHPGIPVEELLEATSTILTYATTSHLTNIMKADELRIEEIEKKDKEIGESSMGKWLCAMQYRATCHMTGRKYDE